MHEMLGELSAAEASLIKQHQAEATLNKQLSGTGVGPATQQAGPKKAGKKGKDEGGAVAAGKKSAAGSGKSVEKKLSGHK